MAADAPMHGPNLFATAIARASKMEKPSFSIFGVRSSFAACLHICGNGRAEMHRGGMRSLSPRRAQCSRKEIRTMHRRTHRHAQD
jgi:hypothetical protein